MNSEDSHVDHFIWERFNEHQYARFVLMLYRLPAMARLDFMPWILKHPLFATYSGKRYRVTGASRFGDVFLSSDGEIGTGYDERVGIESLSDWSAEP